jgi:hypothetical protein
MGLYIHISHISSLLLLYAPLFDMRGYDDLGRVTFLLPQVVMVMGKDIPGGYAGKGTVGMGTDTGFCTRAIPIPTTAGLSLVYYLFICFNNK